MKRTQRKEKRVKEEKKESRDNIAQKEGDLQVKPSKEQADLLANVVYNAWQGNRLFKEGRK